MAEPLQPAAAAPPIDLLDLEPIKKREAKTSEGPWRVFSAETISIEDESGWAIVEQVGEESQQPQVGIDATFIARARTDIPALIAEVEQLRARLRALQGTTSLSSTSKIVGCGDDD